MTRRSPTAAGRARYYVVALHAVMPLRFAVWLLLAAISTHACTPGDELACSLTGACAADGKGCVCDA